MLKTREVLPGLVSFAQPLQRASKPKFSGCMKRAQYKSVLQCGNRFFVLVKLRFGNADEIKRIRIRGNEFGCGIER